MDFQLRFIDKIRINTGLQLEFQMNNQRKLIQLFKTFNERIFVPQLSKSNSSIIQWNNFSALLSNETATIDDIQAYVDIISAVPERQPTYPERNGFALKKKTDSTNDAPSVTLSSQNNVFNPNKTFGGEKARPKFQPKNELDDFTKREEINQGPLNFASRDDGQSRKQNPQIILQALERMNNLFTDNQQRIDFLLFRSQSQSQPQPQPQSERMVFQERAHERGSERFVNSPGEQRQMERNNEMVSNNVQRLANNPSLSNFERTGIERQNIERQNIERQNIERQNIERQNIERQNIERQNTERQNIERQNIERQNIERQNIERSNMMSNMQSMNFERQNLAPPSKYL